MYAYIHAITIKKKERKIMNFKESKRWFGRMTGEEEML